MQNRSAQGDEKNPGSPHHRKEDDKKKKMKKKKEENGEVRIVTAGFLISWKRSVAAIISTAVNWLITFTGKDKRVIYLRK